MPEPDDELSEEAGLGDDDDLEDDEDEAGDAGDADESELTDEDSDFGPPFEARSFGGVSLVGPEATRAALLGRLARPRRWRALHLAGRVEADPERPLLTAFGLASTDADDGRWTAREIAQERIAADVVVLSTCLACGTSCVPDASVSALPR